MGKLLWGPVVALTGALALVGCGEGGGGDGGDVAAAKGPSGKIVGSWDLDGGKCGGLSNVTFTETGVSMKAWGKEVSDTIDNWDEKEGIVLASAQLPALGITSEDQLPLKISDKGQLEMHASFTGAVRETMPEFVFIRCEK
ncbi:MAG TPA: hypothetical protein EYQ81_10880 [Sneathiellales bacterium]|nr:hypothetical protein [Sneathiellales bacterium]